MDVVPLIDINQPLLPLGNIYEASLILEKKDLITSVATFTETVFPSGYTGTEGLVATTSTHTDPMIGDVYLFINYTPTSISKSTESSTTSRRMATFSILPSGYTGTEGLVAISTLSYTGAKQGYLIYNIYYTTTDIASSTEFSTTKDSFTSSYSSSTSPPSTETSSGVEDSESATLTSGSAASSQEAVTTLDSAHDGSTVLITTTVSSSTLTTSSTDNSTHNDNSSGGLTGSNKIVVGVVVGVGGCILIGLISVLFYFKRRRNNRVYGNGWAFWRNHQKLDSDEFINGELGVRDRDFKNMSNF